MTAPKLARAAAKLLADEDLELSEGSAEERDRTVAAIRLELSRRAERGRRRRWGLPLAGVAAAVALLAIGASTWSRHATSSATAVSPAGPAAGPAATVVADAVRGTVYLEQNGERIALRSTSVVARGATVVAMDGEAILVLRSGSKVDVEHATTASLVDDGETERIDVDRGAVTSTVTKRGPSQRFIVRTPDAEVEVRGTVFRVSRLEDPRCGLQTRVHVDEGRVVVRAAQDSATLEPGGEWVSRCLAAAAPATPAALPVPVASNAASSASTFRAPPSSRIAPVAAVSPHPNALPNAAPAPPPPSLPSTAAPSTPASSELAAQNALFADAMSSKARGDTAGALGSLDFLLQKYPRTPLREAAEAQRMNLVATTDPARAVGLAQGYLLRYPHGFARADAEKIVGSSP